MPSTDQVIVQFIADTSELTPGVDQLEQLGALDQGTAVIFTKTNQALKDRSAILQQNLKDGQQLTANVSGQQESYNKLVASVKNLSGQSKEAVQNMLRFATGDIARAFKTSKTSVDDYTGALGQMDKKINTADASLGTLKSQLRTLTEALAQLGPRTAENASQFDAIAFKAGELQNAIKDARQTVAGLGEDVPILKTFGAAAQGITAGFSAASGAIALFGDEGKDLQEVLVRVNALMAVQQGVSQLVALANDKATISTAKLAVAQLRNNAQTAISNGLESESVVVRGAATVAQYAFNLAMSLNPIGIVVIALSAFIAGLVIYTGRAKEAAEQQGKLNAAIDAAGEALDAEIEGINHANEEFVAELQNRNAKESEITRQQATAIVAIIKRRAVQIQEAESSLQTALLSRDKDIRASAEGLRTRIVELKKQQYAEEGKLAVTNLQGLKQVDDERLAAIKANADAQVSLSKKNSDAFFAFQRIALAAQTAIELKDAGDNEEKKNAIRAAAHESFLQITDAQDAQHEANRQNILQTNLLKEQTENRRINSNIDDEETANQIKILKDRAAFELSLRTTTAQDRLRIEAKLQQDIEALQREQASRNIVLANENVNAENKVLLDGIKLTDTERLNLEIETTRNETAIALQATNLTEQKRLALIADGAQKERQLRAAFIDLQAQDQIRANAATFDNANAELQRQLDAQDEIRNAGTRGKTVARQLGVPVLDLTAQKKQIDDLTQFQLSQNAILVDSNQEKFEKGLISQKEFEQTSADLYSQNVKTFEDGEEKKRQASKKTSDFQREQTIALVNVTLQGVSDGLNVLGQLYQQQDQASQQRLDAQKQRIADELEAGNISAKQAAQRNKEIDLQEKKLQFEQAKRAKQLALFQAIISTAEAVVVAFTAGPIIGIVQGAIAAALGAAQIAIIASQPLPSFNRGKKNSYQGFGEVAEKGRPEMIESGGKRYLAKQRSIVWLGSRDKVFTPDETAAMMGGAMNTTTPVIEMKQHGLNIDYDRIGKAVADNIPGMSLNIDGYKEFIQQKNSFQTRLNARRKWK